MKHRPVVLMMSAVSAVLLSGNAHAGQYRERDYDYFPRNEFYIQYGAPSAVEIISMTKSIINDPDPYYSRVCESRNHKYSGVAGIGYGFSVSPQLTFGVYGGFSWSEADVYTLEENGEKVPEFLTYTSGMKNWTVMASAGWSWWQEGSMELSSGLYIGATFLDETLSNVNAKVRQWDVEDDRWTFSYHVSIAKFRIGETVGGFAELGYGYRGILNIGLSIRL